MKSNTSKHFYFNPDRHNFEQQPKRKISTPTDNCQNVIAPLSGTTTPKHNNYTYNKLSSSSTSSMLSVINGTNDNGQFGGGLFNGQPMTMNPFEETNRFRLEQSVLSPNLFHVAATSTPERDSTSLWNIDQRAILYPADIQTDESSLMAQYVYDYKISKQVIPAVEAFWTQNKIIIESPLACSTGSAFRSNFAAQVHIAKHGKANSVNSPLSNNEQMTNNNYSSKKSTSSVSSSVQIGTSEVKKSANKNKKQCKDQVCQTMLQIPIDFDLTKILELKNFFITDQDSTSNTPTKELNNSIRKKLFDQNSEDMSTTSTATNSATSNARNLSTGASILLSKIKSANLEAGSMSTTKKQEKVVGQLPKPEMYANPALDQVKKEALKMRTLASSSSSATTDECWLNDFDDHQFASSPKCEKFSNIIHDIGDFGHDDDLHDSVFECQQHRTPPDLSPLLGDAPEPKTSIHKAENSLTNTPTTHIDNSPLVAKSADNHKSHHHNRFFHFDMNPIVKTDASGGSSSTCSGPSTGSATKKDKNMISPNLSPIRQSQTETSESTIQGPCSGLKQRLVHSSNKNSAADKDRSNRLSLGADEMNVSSSSVFARSIIFMDIGNGNEIVADLDSSDVFNNGGNNSYNQNLSFCEEILGHEHHNHHKREEFYKRVSLGADHVEAENAKKLADLEKYSKTELDVDSSLGQKLVMQDDSDQSSRNSSKQQKDLHLVGGGCSIGSNSTEHNNYTKNYMDVPFLTSLIETTTNTFNHDSQDTGYQTNSGNCGNGSTSINSAQSSSNPSIMIMDTTNNNNNTSFNNVGVCKSRANLPMNIEDEFKENLAVKQADLLGLKNDLRNFIASSSKRQLTKTEGGNTKNNKSLVSQANLGKSCKVKKNSISLNSLENIIQLEADCGFKPIAKKSSFVMSKSSGVGVQVKMPVVYTNSCDISMCTLNDSNCCKSSGELDEEERMVKRKHELDSQYMDQSILLNKITPSEYAKSVLSKARQDLDALANYLGHT